MMPPQGKVLELVDDRLLNRTPKLKRLVLYSRNLRADLESIREQQKRFYLPNLEVFFSVFRDPVKIELNPSEVKFMIADRCIEKLHENYSKLVENSPWRVCNNHLHLFRHFKIFATIFKQSNRWLLTRLLTNGI